MAVGSAFESAGELARELTGGQKFMKYVIIGLAGVYLIFGIVLCAVGSAALAGAAASIAGTNLPDGLIVVGAFLIFTSLVGGLSAWYEFRIGLGFYFGSMLLWTIILLAIGIAVLAAKSNLQSYIASGWALTDCGTQQTIQNSFGCCGRYGQSDTYVQGAAGWNSNLDAVAVQYPTFPSVYNCKGAQQNGCPGPWISSTTGTAAALISAPSGTNCYTNQTWEIQNINCTTSAPGCVSALQSSLQTYWQSAGGAGIAFAVIMAVGLAFTCFLMRGIQTRSTNAAIDKNRAKTQRDLEAKRSRGKGGLKIPDTVL